MTHRRLQNWILRHIYEIHFSIFRAVLCVFGFEVCKKCLIWPEKYFSPNIFKQYKKMQNLGRFWISWKSSKKSYTKKVRGLRTFVHSKKRDFCTLILIIFFVGTFYTFFNKFEISLKFYYFWHTYQMLRKKYF